MLAVFGTVQDAAMCRQRSYIMLSRLTPHFLIRFFLLYTRSHSSAPKAPGQPQKQREVSRW